MNVDAYRLALAGSGKLKMRATALLAEGGRENAFEAAVLFHEAARAERRAIVALPSPAPEARLGAAVEACYCLIEGLDPTAVLELAWGEVLEASERVPARAAQAMRARIDPKMTAFIARYQAVIAKAPALRAWVERGAPPSSPRALGRELDRVLGAFPGDARLWALRSQAWREVAGDSPDAWDAIRRATSLSPEDTRLKGMELALLPRFEAKARAALVLDGVHADIQRGDADAEICKGFILAAFELAARGGSQKKLLRQVEDAAAIGAGRVGAGSTEQRIFRAFQLIAQALLGGRTPGSEVLFRCGLGAWAAGPADEVDPLSILTDRASPLRYARAA